MELSSSAVTFLILTSFAFWSSLYGLFCYFNPHRSYEWNCRFVTLIHAVTIVVLSYVFGIYYNPWPFTHPGGKSSFHEICTMVVCLGYFLYDICWCVWFFNAQDSEAVIMLVHHLITIIGILAALIYGHSGTEVGATIFGAELSNPFLQIRWFMRESGLKETIPYEINDLLFVLSFTICRIVIGTYFMYCELTHPLPALFFKFGALALYLVSWLLMYNIAIFVYRKYFKVLSKFWQGTVKSDKDSLDISANSSVPVSRNAEDVRHRNGHASSSR
ncbi:TLC domain-containing protein 5-like [Asterias rubens]|uniref:TLC domain-containing protein 5-like n=1 Tax=Asterias rubens TaxID=7604 RepID=UPI001455395F|nr:TLC domain-containing protein 5-like [Asterias rubens]